AQPYEGGPEAMPGFQAFLQGFADEAMGNVRNLLS
ncbi:MAG: SRPBCC family protein, partial [Pseudomonas sp.]